YAAARKLLDRIVRERLFSASGVYGFWPAASEDDDVVVYGNCELSAELTRFNLLRQQEAMPRGQANLSLADFIAPRSALSSGSADCLGAFAVTAGLGVDDVVLEF